MLNQTTRGLPGCANLCVLALARVMVPVLSLGMGSLAAWASDDDKRGARVPVLPAYQQECAACHVAFPARGLPAASWQRLMADLPKHFGTDASLDAKTTAEIAQYLQANAATGKRAKDTPPEDRMTRAAWFVREHDEISAAVWKRPSIGKASNCAACHQGAPQGRFGEHDVRIPAK